MKLTIQELWMIREALAGAARHPENLRGSFKPKSPAKFVDLSERFLKLALKDHGAQVKPIVTPPSNVGVCAECGKTRRVYTWAGTSEKCIPCLKALGINAMAVRVRRDRTR